MKTAREAVCTLICAVVLIITTGGVQPHAKADSAALAVSEEKTQLDEAQAAARNMVMRMAEFLAKTSQFSVQLASSYDALQQSGQMIEFGESRKITVNRPDGLRVELTQSDGEQHLVQYDGKQITIFNPLQNVYAQASISGGIDTAIMYFLRDLGMRLPLAMLLTSRLPAEIDRRTQSYSYVEKTVIDETPVHHVAGRTETVDYQAWIPEAGQPLPLRIVLTYKNAEGYPAFRAEFSDWNLTPEIMDSLFVFAPSEKMQKIPFLAELPTVALGDPTHTESSGESK